MPELAEVEYYRKQWDPGLGQKIDRLEIHAGKRIFRGGHASGIARALPGTTFQESFASGKWMLFHFRPSAWLGIHLGMTGALSTASSDYKPKAHDHLVLFQKKRSLVFSDPRLFGRVIFHQGKDIPAWWEKLPPDLLSPEVKGADIFSFLQKRARSPVKAVLLMQERFPGIGNWMADEILWRAEIHPRRHAGSLNPEERKELWKQTRLVIRDALRVIGKDWGDPPDSWLFNHRWKKGGRCPKTGVLLKRETIGGRTTCWSPGRQKP